MKDTFSIGKVPINGTSVPLVSTMLNSADFMGAVMVRWGINRDNYLVSPGLYAFGSPGPTSDVFVTANYKLSFDTLRKNLSGVNGWILVLDTRGVNVWCAAGKGTFGTKELVSRIKLVSLDKIVNHKRIILPQLGATGVAAHIVKEESGFNVHYGPVRASDIKQFISDGYRADKEMRRVTFSFKDRIKLIPNDFIYGKFYLLGAMAVIFIISGLTRNGFSYRDFSGEGGPAILSVFLAYLSGIVITPICLPYIPGRPFALKGFITGSIVFLILLSLNLKGKNIFEIVSWFLIITAISSFLAMNFTGSSTYTSLSGVKKEMKISLPLQIGFAISGIVLQVIGKLN
ncbi:MAG: mercury methylation corrinoid protein HgcA [Bacteroidales bacterium]|nr:mercury methylation corrinoid protein HgcA [Bacteroidales bacterium]